MDSKGNAIAVWSQFNGSGSDIWANRYVPGLGWQRAEIIGSSDGYAMTPRAAMSFGGGAVVAWRQDSTIQANRCVAGLGWQSAEVVTISELGLGGPRVAIDSNGGAVNKLTDSGWATPTPVEDADGSAGAPEIAVDSAGNAVATWAQDDGVRWNIWANRCE